MSVVIGYVASPEGDAALAAGLAEAELRNLRAVIVVSARGRAAAADRAATLTQLNQRLADAAVAHDIRVDDGELDIAETLIDVAADVDAQLIVIGLRRRTAVGKLILGSNAQRILLDAPVPVLAVKA